MGCDYYGTKDKGEMVIEVDVYSQDEEGKWNKTGTSNFSVPVNKGEKIYLDKYGDIRER